MGKPESINMGAKVPLEEEDAKDGVAEHNPSVGAKKDCSNSSSTAADSSPSNNCDSAYDRTLEQVKRLVLQEEEEEEEEGTRLPTARPNTTATPNTASGKQANSFSAAEEGVDPVPTDPPSRAQPAAFWGPGAYAVTTGISSQAAEPATTITPQLHQSTVPVDLEHAAIGLEATLVQDEDDHEENNNTNRSVAQGQAPQEACSVELQEAVPEEASKGITKKGIALFCSAIVVMLLVIVLLSLGLSGVFSTGGGPDPKTTANSITNTTPPTLVSTLDRIQQEGVLKCAYESFPGFITFNEETGEFEGVLAAFYKALAAAANVKPQFVEVAMPNMVPQLLAGEIGVVVRGFTRTMGDEVYQKKYNAGLSYSFPWGYSGIGVGGIPFFIDCVDNKGLKHVDECSELKICVSEATDFQKRMRQLMSERHLVPTNHTTQAGVYNLINGTCNVIAASLAMLWESSVRQFGYTGNYTIGTSTFVQNRPHAAVTRSNDPHFTDFVSQVIQSLHAADKYSITQNDALQAEAASIPVAPTTVFGEEYTNMFRNAVAAVGSYREMMLREIPMGINTVNSVNNGSTGLIFSYPFGSISDRRDTEALPLGATLSGLLERGHLRCGVIGNRKGFAYRDTVNGTTLYQGIDIDYCRALSASLFQGDDSTDSLVLVELNDATEGFQLLTSGELDVVAGATWTLENEIGFTFSRPYFYGYSDNEDNFCLVTRQDDHDWSSFVFWLAIATFHAEETQIDAPSSSQMPEVYVYGPKFKRMFRDAILTVGNYGNIYDRNLASFLPRSGRNMLSQNPNAGPQVCIIPGFI